MGQEEWNFATALNTVDRRSKQAAGGEDGSYLLPVLAVLYNNFTVGLPVLYPAFSPA